MKMSSTLIKLIQKCPMNYIFFKKPSQMCIDRNNLFKTEDYSKPSDKSIRGNI